MKNHIILGVDPGIKNTGLSIVKSKGTGYSLITAETIKTKSSEDTGKRLDTIHEAIIFLLEKYAPQAMCVERVFHNKNINSSISTGKVIGLCEFTAYNYKIPVHLFTPQQIKAASGFGGSANKDEIIKVVSRIFRIKIKSHHTADAALCALAGCLQTRRASLE